MFWVSQLSPSFFCLKQSQYVVLIRVVVLQKSWIYVRHVLQTLHLTYNYILQLPRSFRTRHLNHRTKCKDVNLASLLLINYYSCYLSIISIMEHLHSKCIYFFTKSQLHSSASPLSWLPNIILITACPSSLSIVSILNS